MTNHLPSLLLLSTLFLAASATLNYSNNGTDWTQGICSSVTHRQ